MTPFIVFGLPRSRTYWLSQFLTYGDYECGHDQARHVRTAEDVRLWLSQDFTGTAETGAAGWWRLVKHYRPDAKVLIVRRPVADVVDSLMRLDMSGICYFDRAELVRTVSRMDRHLDRMERELDGAMTVRFEDLSDEATCADLFEFCLPYGHDHERWVEMDHLNLQCNMRAQMRYYATHKEHIVGGAKACAQRLRRLRTQMRPAKGGDEDGVFIQEEPFEKFFRDGQSLFAEHCVRVGEQPDTFLGKNLALARHLDAIGSAQIMTARVNGRMLGYLASIISPSLEDVKKMTATQTIFFASKDARGLHLGRRLQKASIAALKRRHVSEVHMRAGIRADGPRLGALYQRMGAMNFGQLYKLELGT